MYLEHHLEFGFAQEVNRQLQLLAVKTVIQMAFKNEYRAQPAQNNRSQIIDHKDS